MSPREPSYRLLNPNLMKLLMERTGSGSSITGRELAKQAGCSSTTVNDLLSGTKECVLVGTAHGIARVIGVDVLVLFAPTGRSVPVPHSEIPPALVRAAG
ncbi:helix-turn-helix domain-containing protein [Streptomyces sp. H27-H5]|uniref:helix-turn-helix domain-containing protein n=1 Tax=Streptomyces sp. H27-H5 TaxID=2996460 RepID=UPI00226E3671|nr:helix-turn-helix transcriptional regulator [Streptomyces sp. H27-H5]MCY0960806.1 helix-turn-helix transcriptional regulator [Streptomyces sp. H27-H5]